MRKRDSKTAPPGANLTVSYREPSALKAYAGNARKHSDAQIDQIAASIQRFSFRNPILLKDDETTIGAGHGRQAAALRILADPVKWGPLNTPDGKTVPTITLHGLSDAEWRAYVLADNQLALNAEWDTAALAAELEQIKLAAEDLPGITGFSQAELDELLGQAAPTAGDGPSFDYREQFGVIVMCAGEAEQQKVFEDLTGRGLDCRVVVT